MASNTASTEAASVTSQGRTRGEFTLWASGRTRFSSASPWKVKANVAPCCGGLAGDAPGDRAVVGYAHDQAPLASHQAMLCGHPPLLKSAKSFREPTTYGILHETTPRARRAIGRVRRGARRAQPPDPEHGRPAATRGPSHGFGHPQEATRARRYRAGGCRCSIRFFCRLVQPGAISIVGRRRGALSYSTTLAVVPALALLLTSLAGFPLFDDFRGAGEIQADGDRHNLVPDTGLQINQALDHLQSTRPAS